MDTRTFAEWKNEMDTRALSRLSNAVAEADRYWAHKEQWRLDAQMWERRYNQLHRVFVWTSAWTAVMTAATVALLWMR